MITKQLKQTALVVTSIICMIFGLFGVSSLIAISMNAPNTLPQVVSAITAISGLISSILTLTAAVAAIAAVNIWKDKLSFQKKYDAIWNAKEKLHQFKDQYINCLHSAVYATAKDQNQNENQPEKIDRFKADLETCEKIKRELQSTLTAVDAFVSPHEKEIFSLWYSLISVEWSSFKRFILSSNGATLIRSATGFEGEKNRTEKLDEYVREVNKCLHEALAGL